MNIQTKYKIRESKYFINKNRLYFGKINRITIYEYENGEEKILYGFHGYIYDVDQNNVFSTTNEILQSITITDYE